MRRGTTPTVMIDIPYAASEIDKAWITFSQGGEVFSKTLEDDGVELSSNTITVRLSQEDTLKLDAGRSGQSFVKVQARFLLIDGSATGTNTLLLPVMKVEKGGVIK